MGKQPAPKTERNKKLIADYKSGKYTTSQLVAKYDLSTARIYEILDAHNVKRQNT